MNYTPMLRQYLTVKNKHKECIVFFRLGDFYEMFFDDATYASTVLNIVLTARDGGNGNKVPMCGVPYHSADNYIQKLIAAGNSVAICEQVEDASLAKGLVKREVVRIITPGTMVDGEFLTPDKNNFLMGIVQQNKCIGYSIIDVSTGYFACGEFCESNAEELLVDELLKTSPSEVIINADFSEYKFIQNVLQTNKFNIRDFSKEHINTKDYFEEVVDARPAKHLIVGKKAAQLLLSYIEHTQKTLLKRITKLTAHQNDGIMKIDNITKRNLELTETMRDNSKRGSLFWLLDHAVTSMGSRLLRTWILNPLTNTQRIINRQEVVTEFFNNSLLLINTRNCLKNISDIERLIGRIAAGSANGRDLRSLVNSLKHITSLSSLIQESKSIILKKLAHALTGLEDFAEWLDIAIANDPPVSVKEGGVIASGFNEKVDYYRDIQKNGQQWIASLEATERQKTGIKSLKIGFNKVFGYYLDITKANLHLVPEDYIRKQTLANSERFITPELKAKEEDILNAEEALNNLEYSIFLEIIQYILGEVASIQSIATAVATIDVLATMAHIAVKNNYICPEVCDTNDIYIEESRHPVIEQVFNSGSFVPNNIELNDKSFFHIITGPNMSGKSTYMRQIALIVLMAQIGSFVPAKCAVIGVTDRLFTRVGASDDIFSGHSTFMVEMQEVANICRNASHKSFIILDEIGRGTSTYDGMSIARAVSEYLYKYKCRVLFATHYHELTDLADKYKGIANYSVAVHENGQDIVFLHKIIAGPSNRSYGIHVCKLAGVPEEVINDASHYLYELENGNSEVAVTAQPELRHPENENIQAILEELKGISPQHITPFNALTFIFKWQSELMKVR